MSITPKNWTAFQHYKDRHPAWIKLHRGLLDDYEYSRLPIASRALAPLLWLLASEYEGGKITGSIEELAFRLHMTEVDLREALTPLIERGFFSDDSGLLAECEQVAIPERETEKQEKTERDIRTVAKATRPDGWFEIFWKEIPKRKGANPKAPAEKLFSAARKSGVEPETIIAAAKRWAEEDRDKIGTEFLPQAVKWLRDRRWEDYSGQSEPSPDAYPALPGTPEFVAWRAKHEADGKPFMLTFMDRKAEENQPYLAPQRWPPGHEARAA